MLVVNKPSMLLSVPGRGPDKQDSLATRIQSRFPDATIVHRLDWETSGVMVMALNADSHRELSRQFHDREVNKAYVAVVYGQMEAEYGEIDLPMRCDIDNRPRQIIDHQHGKWALTRWQMLEHQKDRTRLLLKPVTGRSHQLRVHLQAIGHPILGDSLYAHTDAQTMANRLMLHAHTLSFKHPQNSEPMNFKVECPF